MSERNVKRYDPNESKEEFLERMRLESMLPWDRAREAELKKRKAEKERKENFVLNCLKYVWIPIVIYVVVRAVF